jgi:hypothetical protein
MIEILVNNQLIDLSSDFSILINKTIADIREPEKRSSDWSKTIELPGTPRNNKLFGHIFEIEHTVLSDTQFNTNFNPNQKADAVVIADGIIQMQGFIRLISINITDSKDILYSCTIHGQTADLFTTISEKNLYELDFSKYNHELTVDNVVNSWDTSIIVDGTSTPFQYGNGYVYALIDKASKKTPVHYVWELNDVTPCLYAKTVTDKIFSNAGYKYTSDSFFNTDRFKHLIIPAPAGLSINTLSLTDNLFQAERTISQTILYYNTTLVFDNDATGGNFDNGNNYNPSNGHFTVPVGGTYTFYLDINATIDTSAYGNLGNKYIQVYLGMKVNGQIKSTVNFFAGDQNAVGIQEIQLFPNISLYSGDVVEFCISHVFDRKIGAKLPEGMWVFTLNNTSKLYNDISAYSWGNLQLVDFTQFFNAEGKQSDFLMSLVKMFNLYIEPDKDQPKTLRIVTRDEFYNGDTIDLSKKLDYSQAFTITPMGELDANPYYFTYKEGGDEVNKAYQDVFRQPYGAKKVFIDNQFIKSEKKIEVMFEPTQMQNYGSEKDFVLSFVPTDKLGYRILYFSDVKTVLNYVMPKFSSGSDLANTTYRVNKLPITLHVDSATNMDFDLSFGMPREVLLGAGYSYSSNNLFNTYWYRFVYEITNKNSKIFKGYFRITPQDFSKLRFCNNYFFEGQYWKLNKVNDYNPYDDGVYELEFLLSQYIEPNIGESKKIGADTGTTIGEDFPKGKVYKLPTQNGVLVGTNNDDVNQNQGIINGRNSSGATESFFNSVLGGDGVELPPGVEGSTMIGCTDFQPTKSETLYYQNYEVHAPFVSAGKTITITSNYTATLEDWLILCNTNAGVITVTLPNPIEGKHFVIKHIGGNHNITITCPTCDIDGNATHSNNKSFGSDWIASNGVNYYIISEVK